MLQIGMVLCGGGHVIEAYATRMYTAAIASLATAEQSKIHFIENAR